MSGRLDRCVLAAMVCLIAACASSPIRYYTLSPAQSPAPAVSEAAPVAIDVRVTKDEIKGAFILELGRRLAESPGFAARTTRVSLDVEVRVLEAELDRYARLDAMWRATLVASNDPAESKRVTSCTFQTYQPISGGYSGMVAGYQHELVLLADEVVRVMTRAEVQDSGCR